MNEMKTQTEITPNKNIKLVVNGGSNVLNSATIPIK